MYLDNFLEQRRYEMAARYVRDKAKVLDIGGRQGKFVNYLGTEVKYTAIDKEGTVNNILKFRSSSFDYVTMLAVIEHIKIEDMWELQKEIYRVLKQTGFLIITTPATFSKPVLEFLALFKLINSEDIKEHKVYYNVKRIKRVFFKFRVLYWTRFNVFNQVFILCKNS